MNIELRFKEKKINGREPVDPGVIGSPMMDVVNIVRILQFRETSHEHTLLPDGVTVRINETTTEWHDVPCAGVDEE